MANKKKVADQDQSLELNETPTVNDPSDPTYGNDDLKAEKSGSIVSSGFVIGMVLIVLGALFLLNNLGFMDINFSNIMRLWPLILIMIGVSMLSIRGVVGRILGIVVVLLLLAILAMASVGFISPNQYSETSPRTQEVEISQESNGSNPAKVRIDAGIGKLEIDSAAIDSLVQAHLESSFAQLNQSSSVKDGVQEVILKSEGSMGWWSGKQKNDLFVTLSELNPIKLEVKSGASDVAIDASKMRMESLKLDSGASKVDVRLGDKVEDVSLDLDMGMSSMTLKVPEESGVRIELESGLSNIEFDDLVEVEEGVYESKGFKDAANQITIVGDMGMSNFEIKRY